MTKPYLKLTHRETQDFDPRGTILNVGAKLALRWLRTSLAGAKEISARMGIGERTIYKWVNGEAPIPADRVEQIIWVCKTLKAGIDQLDGETDLYLAEKYGRAA